MVQGFAGSDVFQRNGMVLFCFSKKPLSLSNVLTWAVQRGTAFLTTSVTPARIQENFELSTLPENAMQEIRDRVATRIRFNIESRGCSGPVSVVELKPK